MKTSQLLFTRRCASLLLCFSLALPFGLVSGLNAEALSYPSPVIKRHAGVDRYDTAELASRAAYPNPAVVSNLIVVTGEDFPDALTVAPLAAALQAPVVLTQPAKLSEQAKRECQRLMPDTVYIIGENSAISTQVETELAGLAKVKRIGGAMRYDTAVLLAKELATVKNVSPTEAFLVNASGFADALSIGALAAQLGAPLLLTDSEKLSAASSTYLKDNNINTVTIIGGTTAVSSQVERDLSAKGVTSVSRLGGTDRFDTASMVLSYARSVRNVTFTSIAIASGTNFPDAVVAAANLGCKGGLALISTKDTLSPYIAKLLTSYFPLASIEIYGGKTALSERLESTVYSLFGLLKTVTSNNLTVSRAIPTYAYDVYDLSVLTGAADHVFVGLVEQMVSVSAEDNVSMPTTTYALSVIQNIKGDLGNGQIKIDKEGGVFNDAKELCLMEEDFLPEVGDVYVFVAYVQENGSLLVVGVNSNTLLLINNASLSAAELKAAVVKTDIYQEFVSAFNTQKNFARQRYTYQS